MRVIHYLEDLLPERFLNLILTLGAFDGVHLGHQRILRFVKKRAQATRGTACVFTFKEHPQKILNPHENLSILTSASHKLSLMSQFGMDVCLAIDFTKEFSKLTPERFIEDVLVKRLQVKEVYLGADARFGHERKGRVAVMEKLAVRHGFRFGVIPAYQVGGETVSSTLIRNLISQGKIQKASRMLGRPYSIVGKVVPGSGRGKDLGFPTANVDPESEVLPPNGVYIVSVNLIRENTNHRIVMGEDLIHELRIEERIQGILNLGTRPTFNSKPSPVTAEAHLLDWSADLYGRTLEIIFHQWLRAERRFENEAHLREKVLQDREAARKFFRRVPLQRTRQRIYFKVSEAVSL